MLLSCHVQVSEWIYTYTLPKCQGTPCSKQALYLKLNGILTHSNGILTHNHLVRERTLNSWVFVYELNDCGFESHCCHLNILEVLITKKPKY